MYKDITSILHKNKSHNAQHFLINILQTHLFINQVFNENPGYEIGEWRAGVF